MEREDEIKEWSSVKCHVNGTGASPTQPLSHKTSRIRETPNLSTDADSSTNTIKKFHFFLQVLIFFGMGPIFNLNLIFFFGGGPQFVLGGHVIADTKSQLLDFKLSKKPF